MTIAYIYKWTHIATSKWYIGVRTKKGCHPEDGYICSSKIVKPMIEQAPNEWHREILFTGTPEEMLRMEVHILTELDAKNNVNSYNMQNGDGKWTTTGLIMSDEWKQKISNGNTGKKRTEEAKKNCKRASQEKAKNPEYLEKLRKPKPPSHGANVSKALSGKSKSLKHKENLAKSQKAAAAKNRTGKTYDEIFGPERAEQIKKASSNSQKGRPCNNPTVACPHCEKYGPSGAMHRWHFDNCKKKNK